MEDFEATFLSRDALRRFILYLCSLNTESPDPITDALVTAMTETVRYTISKHGLMLFKGTSPLPFNRMDAAQRHLIYEVVSSIRCEVHTYGPFAYSENPLTFSVENERITVNVPPVKLDHALVLSILVDLIRASAKPSMLLFNIMIQRLSARVHITKDVLAQVTRECKEKFTSAGATAPEPAPSQQSAAATR
jgi:hypothetical protein